MFVTIALMIIMAPLVRQGIKDFVELWRDCRK